MARITVEDCLEVVDNRFDLVLMATQRARQLERGAEAMVDDENDKPTVIALREIAERKVDQAMIDEIDLQMAARAAAQELEWATAAVDEELARTADDQ